MLNDFNDLNGCFAAFGKFSVRSGAPFALLPLRQEPRSSLKRAVSFGAVDFEGVFTRSDIWPRPLGEHAWFSVPILGELMYSIGAVDGTRRNCHVSMQLI